MTQLSLFETSKEISLTEETIAVNHNGRWEIYWYGYSDEPWIERFSHYATPGESLQCYGVSPRG